MTPLTKDEGRGGHRRFEFGPFLFDTRTGELITSGSRVRLQPQPAAVLTLLLDEAGELVSREEIQSRVWGGTVVDYDQGLNYCIRQLRSVLGDDAAVPKYIETFRGRGYRFVAPVTTALRAPELEAAERAGKGWRLLVALAAVLVLGGAIVVWTLGDSAPADERIKVAVLPFDTRHGDAAELELSTGIAQAITTELTAAAADALGVIGPISTSRYDGMSLERLAGELEVVHVVSGGLEIEGDTLHIYVQLLRTSDRTHLWADRYRLPLGDPDALQERVVKVVTGQLLRRILAPEAPESPADGG